MMLLPPLLPLPFTLLTDCAYRYACLHQSSVVWEGVFSLLPRSEMGVLAAAAGEEVEEHEAEGTGAGASEGATRKRVDTRGLQAECHRCTQSHSRTHALTHARTYIPRVHSMLPSHAG